MLALPPSLADERFRRATFSRSICPRSLQRYSNVAVAPMAIVVNTGHVTLEGVVNNEMEKNVAGIRASGAGLSFGQVTNNLQVEKPSKKG